MWVAESQYEVLGTRFGVRFDDVAVHRQVDDLLGLFRQPNLRPVRAANLFALATNRPGDDRHHAYRDCRRIGRSDSWIEVFDGFLAEINRRAIEEMAYFGVHAGVVATVSRTIAFPAASGAGKSTLAAACLQAGFAYVSDEALCLDYSNGSVVPYPKPLNLSAWSIENLGIKLPDQTLGPKSSKTPVSIRLMDGEVAANPPALSVVVFLQRVPGVPRIDKVPPSRVLAGLLSYSFNHYRRPADAFALTAGFAQRCSGWALSYDDPHEAAKLLLKKLS